MPETLPDLIRAAVAKLGTQEDAATAIGITSSRLGRIKKGDEYSLAPLHCLRLAKVLNHDPSAVLRAAGKATMAEAIEALYGGNGSGLKAEERQILDDWSRIPAEVRPAVRMMIRLAAERQQPARRRRRSS